jgi:hypothetical protein
LKKAHQLVLGRGSELIVFHFAEDRKVLLRFTDDPSPILDVREMEGGVVCVLQASGTLRVVELRDDEDGGGGPWTKKLEADALSPTGDGEPTPSILAEGNDAAAAEDFLASEEEGGDAVGTGRPEDEKGEGESNQPRMEGTGGMGGGGSGAGRTHDKGRRARNVRPTPPSGSAIGSIEKHRSPVRLDVDRIVQRAQKAGRTIISSIGYNPANTGTSTKQSREDGGGGGSRGGGSKHGREQETQGGASVGTVLEQDAYERLCGAVSKEVKVLRGILIGVEAKEKERVWKRNSTEGELDDTKLVEVSVD